MENSVTEIACRLRRRLKTVVQRGRDRDHATTVRRWLSGSCIVWRRARPTLCIADPRKEQRMRAIRRALRDASASDEIIYVDEADIDLNPRIGVDAEGRANDGADAW